METKEGTIKTLPNNEQDYREILETSNRIASQLGDNIKAGKAIIAINDGDKYPLLRCLYCSNVTNFAIDISTADEEDHVFTCPRCRGEHQFNVIPVLYKNIRG